MFNLLKGITLVCLCFILACRSKTPQQEKPDFIDVSAYLKGQLAYLDTVPFAFEKTTLKDSVYTDTVFLNKEQLKALVAPFLTEELEKKNFQRLYKETLFADAGINSITLTYEPENNGELQVQRVDVYVSPETQQIDKLYIVRSSNSKDSSLTQQLLWKHNKSCSIITTVYKPDQTEKVINEKINWNDTEE